jgi:hypothetical protein
MFWVRFCIATLGLIVCTTWSTAGEIERRTDAQGTIKITTTKPDKATHKATDKAADEAADEAGKPTSKFIYRSDEIKKGSHPKSRRPIDPYNSLSGTPTKVRPSPYVDPPLNPDISPPSPPPVATPAPKSPLTVHSSPQSTDKQGTIRIETGQKKAGDPAGQEKAQPEPAPPQK